MYGWGETEDYSPSIIKGLIQNVNSVNNLCYGGNSGEINITTANTGSGLAYSIDGGAKLASPNFNNLSNGLYNVCVFDSLTNQPQCYSLKSVIIDSPDSLFAVASTQDVSCFNGVDGELNAEAFNGSPNYSYS